jgi:hypothetical protein
VQGRGFGFTWLIVLIPIAEPNDLMICCELKPLSRSIISVSLDGRFFAGGGGGRGAGGITAAGMTARGAAAAAGENWPSEPGITGESRKSSGFISVAPGVSWAATFLFDRWIRL